MPLRDVRPALILVLASLVLGGCVGDPGDVCPRTKETAATPATILPCAAEAARHWDKDAVLVAVEGAVLVEPRPLDGRVAEWRFVYADMEARVSRGFVVASGGAVLKEDAWSWGEDDAPAPHADGYAGALDAAWLDTARIVEALDAEGVPSDARGEVSTVAYALVSTRERTPYWYVYATDDEAWLRAIVDPGDWSVVGWTGSAWNGTAEPTQPTAP